VPGPKRPLRRTRRGVFQLRLPAAEREILRFLPGQLREMLDANDAATERLFPPAYGEDEEKSEEFAGLVRDDLMKGRLGSIEVMEATIDSESLTEDELIAWLGALNDLRLVLGTKLDVTEDMHEVPLSDPRAQAFALYGYLTWLVDQVVESLAEGVDPAGAEPTA
jgi:uncharacterized protein DUF2017